VYEAQQSHIRTETSTSSGSYDHQQKASLHPMTYTREQLIDALVKEYEWLCHDDFDPENDPTPEEYLDAIKDLSYDELVEETSTDDTFTLDQFIHAYS
jgi:hypothetical protein